jgi:ribosomal protein S18 acetylase RimI-like enzyme
MPALEAVGDIEYDLLEPAELDSMISLLAAVFSRGDPPAVAVGLSAIELQRLVSAFGPKVLAEELTVLARDASTGSLLGALLAEDFGTPPPSGVEESAPGFAPIGALLDSLDRQYRASHTVVPGTHLHLFMLGVTEHASGRGIAGHLVNTCLANGKRRGYTVAVTEATGSISQRVFRKLGFRSLLTEFYRDFLFNGKAVFSSIVGPEGTILMEREL